MNANTANDSRMPSDPAVRSGALLGRLVATKYRIPCENTRDEISIQERRQTNPVEHIKWAVCQWGNVLSKDGEWECEPTPSNRDSDFLTRCRFDSLEDACMAIEHLGRPLAHKDGINLVFGLLTASGAMCPKCGFGTRVTSKKWARCKKCGERVERVKMSDIKVVVGRPPSMPNEKS